MDQKCLYNSGFILGELLYYLMQSVICYTNNVEAVILYMFIISLAQNFAEYAIELIQSNL